MKDLKKELKTLKLNNSSINIIKYAAKQIRSSVDKNPISITVATDNDGEKYANNFWFYAKKVFRPGTLFFHLSMQFRVLSQHNTNQNFT